FLSAGPPERQPRSLNEQMAQEQPAENGAVRDEVGKSQDERERNQKSTAEPRPARHSPGILIGRTEPEMREMSEEIGKRTEQHREMARNNPPLYKGSGLLSGARVAKIRRAQGYRRRAEVIAS